MREAEDSRRRALGAAARRARDARRGASAAARDTPLNRPIGPHRRFDWLDDVDLSEIKEVRRALGGSLNDVVLTIVTGAVRALPRAAPRRVSTASTSA